MKSAMIIGERYRQRLEKPLSELGIDVLWLCDNPYLDPRLAGHADLSAIRLGKKLVVSRHIEENPLYVNFLTYRGYEVCAMNRAQRALYPDDSALCACIAGRYLIHNLRCTDPVVLENFQGETIHVNQGYAKCSCCVPDGGALISADSGIERAVRGLDIDMLTINHGGIVLDGFEYGFIGGASIVLDGAVLFTGELSDKHDRLRVEAFVRSRGKQPVYLSRGPAFDIGGAVVL